MSTRSPEPARSCSIPARPSPACGLLEKYAARMGGAENHRMRLDDGLLIKDNHVGVCGGVAEAVRAAKAYDSGLPIQVEVDRIEQIEAALEAGADRLLLDNMKPRQIARSGLAGRRQGSAGSFGRRQSRHDPRHCRDRRRLYLGRTDHPVGARRSISASIMC